MKKSGIVIGSIALAGVTYYIITADESVDQEERIADREAVISVARGDIGKVMQDIVWKDVNPAMQGVKSWCGAWILYVLRKLKLTQDV